MIYNKRRTAMNKCLTIFFALVAFMVSWDVAAVDSPLQLCNGRSNQGKLLFGAEFVMRTGMCNDYDETKGLLLTEDALKRIAYDAKVNPELLRRIMTSQYAESYRSSVLSATDGMINSGKAIDKIAAAAGENPPATMDGNGQPIASEASSAAIDCKKEQDSARCYVTAVSELKAVSTQNLLDIMTIKSTMARDKIMSVIMEKVVQEMDIDTSNEDLKYPKGYEPKKGENSNE